MSSFHSQYSAFLETFGKGRKMVLSTSQDGVVSSRMMSVVRLDGTFYFQTDRTFRKYQQISANPHVALCADNIQLEGLCREIGRPLEHPGFSAAFQECFPKSCRYSALENERLFAVTPVRLELWVYENGEPFVELYDIKGQRYEKRPYLGV